MIEIEYNKEVFLIFKEGDGKDFLAKGFGHIDVLIRTNFHWLYLKLRRDRLVAKTIHMDDNIFLPKFYVDKYGYKIIKVDLFCEEDIGMNLNPINILSCVTLAKYVIGLRNFFIQTPYSLYKFLKKYEGIDYKSIINIQEIL